MSQENEYIENDILEEEELEEEFESAEDNNEDDSEDSTDYESLYRAEKERREKAEKAIIKKKEADKRNPVKNNTKQLSESAIEKTVLKAQGFTNEQLDLLEKIAHVNDISILDAKDNPIYKALEAEKQKQEEIKNASLPASKKGRTRKISIDDTKQKLYSSDDDLSPEELELLIKNHKR